MTLEIFLSGAAQQKIFVALENARDAAVFSNITVTIQKAISLLDDAFQELLLSSSIEALLHGEMHSKQTSSRPIAEMSLNGIDEETIERSREIPSNYQPVAAPFRSYEVTTHTLSSHTECINEHQVDEINNEVTPSAQAVGNRVKFF